MTDVLEQPTAASTGRVKILAITDEVDGRLYNPGLEAKRGRYDLVISCGDIPPYYIDFVGSMVHAPVYGVHGNHDASLIRRASEGGPDGWGMLELHGRVIHEHGLLIGGFDGCLRYNDGSYQYSELGMQIEVARMVPRLLLNKLRYGRYLDILVTHAPPRHIHDQPDRPHQGFKVFRWFLKTFRPRYHLHGHIHIYDKRTVTRTEFHDTVVLNTYPYREISVEVGAGSEARQVPRR